MKLINELREAMAALDATITNPDMKGVDDRPPTGDDYNDLVALVEGWLKKADAKLPALERRLRDIAAGARSKADLIASKSPTSVYTDPVDVLRALAKEAERGLGPDPDKGLEIQRTLVLSVDHMDPSFGAYLDFQAELRARVVPGEGVQTLIVDRIGVYGWRICLTDPACDTYMAECEASANLELALPSLIRFGRQHHCEWLNLDQDGPIVDALPTYDW